jgi:hypothetical protein
MLLHAPAMAAHIAGGGNLESLLKEWSAALGPVFEWQVPAGPPVLVVTDPDAIREVKGGPGWDPLGWEVPWVVPRLLLHAQEGRCEARLKARPLCTPAHVQVYEIQQLAKSPRYMDLLPLLGAQSMVLTEGSVWRAQVGAHEDGQHAGRGWWAAAPAAGGEVDDADMRQRMARAGGQRG